MSVPVDIETAFRTELAGERNSRVVIHNVCQLPNAHVSLNDATLLKAEYNNCAVVIFLTKTVVLVNLLFCSSQKRL
jgi:hypothetical protein